jgi:protein tyrosine phosphatase (PTP) superfamily phosphohydrolase (DUF442 family)
MSTQEIYNYLKIDEQLITGGQPTEDQLKSAAEDGFTAVINLATYDPRYSLKDEAALVSGFGMAYYHIPVEWERPLDRDFTAFEDVYRQLTGRKTLLHCAANFRVTAFYSLYALKNLGWTVEQAEQFRATIWQGSDHPVWEEFIRKMESEITQKK